MTSLTKKEAVLTFHWLQDVTTYGKYHELLSKFCSIRRHIDTTMFSDLLVIVYLFSKLWGVHLFVRLGLASDLIVHDIFTWGMSWTLHIELGFVHLNFPGHLINEMTCFHR